jgi:hypothetical protein
MGSPSHRLPLGHRDFADSTRRPVYADQEGHQYVHGNIGERVNGTWPPKALRAVRAIHVLELAGTAEAKEVLRTLAGGAPEAPVTQEARASLERLAKRGAGLP